MPLNAECMRSFPHYSSFVFRPEPRANLERRLIPSLLFIFAFSLNPLLSSTNLSFAFGPFCLFSSHPFHPPIPNHHLPHSSSFHHLQSSGIRVQNSQLGLLHTRLRPLISLSNQDRVAVNEGRLTRRLSNTNRKCRVRRPPQVGRRLWLRRQAKCKCYQISMVYLFLSLINKYKYKNMKSSRSPNRMSSVLIIIA